jgi:hypothetical protein
MGDRLFLVVNASRKHVDLPLIESVLPRGVTLRPLPDRALLALQGPGAVAALATILPDLASLKFMGVWEGQGMVISRSGYTGEDGVEISVPAEQAEGFAKTLLALPGVMPAGLGARDSLRLEAGLCLYGNDIDETTSPVEANLVWSIGKRRRMEWNFAGAETIRGQLDHGVSRLRVGIQPQGRQPARRRDHPGELGDTHLSGLIVGQGGHHQGLALLDDGVDHPARQVRTTGDLDLVLQGRLDQDPQQVVLRQDGRRGDHRARNLDLVQRQDGDKAVRCPAGTAQSLGQATAQVPFRRADQVKEDVLQQPVDLGATGQGLSRPVGPVAQIDDAHQQTLAIPRGAGRGQRRQLIEKGLRSGH